MFKSTFFHCPYLLTETLYIFMEPEVEIKMPKGKITLQNDITGYEH